jgi:hypothetical protein
MIVGLMIVGSISLQMGRWQVLILEKESKLNRVIFKKVWRSRRDLEMGLLIILDSFLKNFNELLLRLGNLKLIFKNFY